MNAEEWTTQGSRVTDPQALERLRHILDDESPLIIEHRFYRGSRSPHRFICEDFATLQEYLRAHGRPGDAFCFWRVEECCRDDNIAASGKVPDADGRTPIGGVY